MSQRGGSSRVSLQSASQQEGVDERVARVRIELRDIEPKIWRRFDIPLSVTLETLHEAIQISMGWTFSHLWQFNITGLQYVDPELVPPYPGERLYNALNTQFGTAIRQGMNRFEYTYDFGDCWEHDVIIEDVGKGDPDRKYPVFVDGAGQCPPEDVGGTIGFEEFLEVLQNPQHEEYEGMIDWAGGPFDPAHFDEEHVRLALEKMAIRHSNPLARH